MNVVAGERVINTEEIRENLRIIRAMELKTVQEIADIVGMSKQSVSNYLKGITKEIPMSIITKLSKEFGYNIDWILTGKGEMFITKKNVLSDCVNSINTTLSASKKLSSKDKDDLLKIKEIIESYL